MNHRSRPTHGLRNALLGVVVLLAADDFIAKWASEGDIDAVNRLTENFHNAAQAPVGFKRVPFRQVCRR